MTPLRLTVRLVPELRSPLVKVFDRIFFLFQKIGNQALSTLFNGLLFGKQFLYRVSLALFRHGSFHFRTCRQATLLFRQNPVLRSFADFISVDDAADPAGVVL